MDSAMLLLQQKEQSLNERAGLPPDRTLRRMREALRRLDLPPIPVFSVAGTNGKGSVSKMTFDALVALGKNPGLYTSPHLVSITERIRTRDGLIDPASLCSHLNAVFSVERDIADVYGRCTYFECLTLAAMRHFSACGCDLAILEAGVGGRYDATRAVDNAIGAAITSLSLDHTAYLGTDIASIAHHKAGIFRPAPFTAITLATGEALAVIEREAQEKGVLLFTRRDVAIEPHEGATGGFDGTGDADITFLPMDLRATLSPAPWGRYRRENVATALGAIGIALDALSVEITARVRATVDAAVSNTSWPGRLQTLCTSPAVVVDGAHNEDAMEKLLDSVDDRPHGRLIIIAAFMDTKAYRTMLALLRRKADLLIVTTNGSDHAVDPGALQNLSGADAAFADLAQALDHALEVAHPEDMILITGSLYLVGEALSIAHERGWTNDVAASLS